MKIKSWPVFETGAGRHWADWPAALSSTKHRPTFVIRRLPSGEARLTMMFILSVGSDPDALGRRSSVLAEAGYAIVSVTDMPKAAEKIANEEFDMVILCNSLVEENRRQLINMIRRHRPFMPMLLIPEGSNEDEIRRRVFETLGEPASRQASSQAV